MANLPSPTTSTPALSARVTRSAQQQPDVALRHITFEDELPRYPTLFDYSVVTGGYQVEPGFGIGGSFEDVLTVELELELTGSFEFVVLSDGQVEVLSADGSARPPALLSAEPGEQNRRCTLYWDTTVAPEGVVALKVSCHDPSNEQNPQPHLFLGLLRAGASEHTQPQLERQPASELMTLRVIEVSEGLARYDLFRSAAYDALPAGVALEPTFRVPLETDLRVAIVLDESLHLVFDEAPSGSPDQVPVEMPRGTVRPPELLRTVRELEGRKCLFNWDRREQQARLPGATADFYFPAHNTPGFSKERITIDPTVIHDPQQPTG